MIERALEAARAGKVAEATELLRQVLASEPRHPDALQLLGMMYRRSGDNRAAVELFSQSLEVDPWQAHVHNNMGNALATLGRQEEAIAAYAEAIRLAPDYVDAMVNLGLAQIAIKDEAAAIGSLSRAVGFQPGNSRAWSALGRALRASGSVDEAIQAFQESLTIRPGDIATLHNLGVALRLAERAEEAAKLLEACAAAQDGKAEIHYNLGHCYQDMGRFDEAATAYRKAIAINPLYLDAHDTLSRLAWQQGMGDRYLESYLAALGSYPRNPELLADLAAKLNLEGRTAEVIALAQGVDSPPVRYRLAQALCAEGRIEEGLAELAMAIGRDGACKDYRFELARQLIVQERYADALTALAPVLDCDPLDQQAIAYRALAWRFLGDRRHAEWNDYERFVSEEILQPPGGETVAAFNARLETALTRLHSAVRHPLDQTLRGGTQTMGELFRKAIPEIATLRAMIEQAVGRYIAAMPGDTAHPFRARAEKSFRFSGSWSVRLRQQGFHVDHVHSAGWISSCYYVGLPDAVTVGQGQEGWLKFGETSLRLGGREQIARTVRPEVGKLVLFPSYFYHGTVPFDGDGHRTTVAFDVVPAKAAGNG